MKMIWCSALFEEVTSYAHQAYKLNDAIPDVFPLKMNAKEEKNYEYLSSQKKKTIYFPKIY